MKDRQMSGYRWGGLIMLVVLMMMVSVQGQVALPYMETFDSYTTGVGVTSRAEDTPFPFSTRTKPAGWLFPLTYDGDDPQDATVPYIWLDQATDGTWAGGSHNVCAGSVTHLECRTLRSISGYACLPLVASPADNVKLSLYYLTETGNYYTLYIGIISQATIDNGSYSDYTRLKSFTGTPRQWVKIEEDMEPLIAASTYSGSRDAGQYRFVLEFVNSSSLLGHRVYVDSVGMEALCGGGPYSENFDHYTYDANKISNDNTFDGAMENPVDYPNHTLPDCWDFPQMTALKNPDMTTEAAYHPQCWLNNEYYHSAPYALVMKGLDGIPSIAALPVTMVPASSVTLTFWYYFEDGYWMDDYEMQVGLITNVADSTTFVKLYDCPKVGSWQQFTVNFADYLVSDYAAGTYRVALRYINHGGLGYRAVVDDVSLNVPACCTTPCLATTGTDVQAACGSFTWIDGNTYTASTTTPTHRLTNSCGGDSTVTLHLTLTSVAHAATTESACNSYTWTAGSGQTYTASGNYTYSHIDANGCTQVDTLHLTIATGNNTATTAEAFRSYTWIDGNTYTSSGTYRYSHGSAGCTQVDTLHLTVYPCPGVLPYSEDFDSYSGSGIASSRISPANPVRPTCWLYPGMSSAASVMPRTFLSTSSSYRIAGKGLVMQSTARSEQAFSVIAIDFGVPNERLELSFQGKVFSGIHLEWGYMTDPTDTTTFTRIGHTTTTSWVAFTDTLARYAPLPSARVFLAFRGYRTSSGNTLAMIDNVKVRRWCDSSITTITAGDSYTWTAGTGLTYTQSGHYRTTVPGPGGCDSILHLNLNISGCPPTDSTMTVAACGSYTWIDGNTYTSSTSTPVRTYPGANSAGCDSTVYLHLTINNPTHTALTENACGSYTWASGNGTTYTTSGNYQYSHADPNGCTQVDTLHLTINNPVHGVSTAVVCENYQWTDGDGQTYTVSGNYTYSHTDANGCTQVDTLHLTVNNAVHTALVVSACGSYTWADGDGQTYTMGGNYTYSHTDAHNCTQVDTLHLTVNNIIPTSVSQGACESFQWVDGDGQTYTTSGDYVYSHLLSNGCTQVDTLHLTIYDRGNGVQTVSACDSLWWKGNRYTASGDYRFDTLTVRGCDSTLTLQLTVNRSGTSRETMRGCDSVDWHGTTYYASGEYDYHTYTVGMCDSTITLDLTMGYATEGDTAATACDRMDWYGMQMISSGDYVSHHYTNQSGCDSALTLHLTINRSTTREMSQSVCDSLTWNGVLYEESCTPVYVTTNADGCDSITTLQLTVNRTQWVDTFATACDGFEWHGTLYENDNVVRWVEQDENGCDSMIFLILTVKYSTQSVLIDTVVENDLPYRFLGTTFNESVTGRRLTTENAVGCDSVIEFTLVVMENQEVYYNSAVCQNHLPMTWNGQTIGGAGDYTARLHTLHGADSTVHVHLTVNPSYLDTVEDHVCNGASVEYKGERYEAEGLYNIMYSSQHGCDSMVVLDLRTHEFHAAVKPLPEILRTDHLEYKVHDITGGEVIGRRWYVNWVEQPPMPSASYAGEADPLADSVIVSLVANSAYCEDSTSVVIPIYHTNTYAPNVFTPLEEFCNRFVVVIEDVVESDLTIYDREGRLVYTTTDLTQGWDGRNTNGQYCPQGSYVWRLEYTTADQPTRRHVEIGQVLLLR